MHKHKRTLLCHQFWCYFLVFPQLLSPLSTTTTADCQKRVRPDFMFQFIVLPSHYSQSFTVTHYQRKCRTTHTADNCCCPSCLVLSCLPQFAFDTSAHLACVCLRRAIELSHLHFHHSVFLPILFSVLFLFIAALAAHTHIKVAAVLSLSDAQLPCKCEKAALSVRTHCRR